MTNTKNIKIKKNVIKGFDLVLRWQLCQNIGKVFYKSDLTYEQLEQYQDIFQRSDVLPKQLPTINLK